LTGIPRETVRRRTKSLSDAGVLMLDGKTYRIAPAFTELLASVCDALTKPAATKSS
jgi:DNA-binding IclR family transcriptional regulator